MRHIYLAECESPGLQLRRRVTFVARAKIVLRYVALCLTRENASHQFICSLYTPVRLSSATDDMFDLSTVFNLYIFYWTLTVDGFSSLLIY